MVFESPFIEPPRPKVKAYWWKGRSVANWGDWLTPLLLSRFAHVDPIWTERGSAEVVVVGSILGHIMGPWYSGTILGAGKLFEHESVPRHAAILALRGPLSARHVPGSYALGDPGLLADELVRIETKKYDLCLIPHFSDKSLAQNPEFTKYDHVVIDPAMEPLAIIRTIAESRKVVSSSLHGLILADALAIPRRFEPTADWSKEGGYFKVRDHNAAVGLPFAIGKLQEADANRVVDRKTDLKDALREYGRNVVFKGDLS
jgi:polysaccharide pyruvyl transferase